MKKAVIVGKRKAELIEVEDPQPREDWALIKVHAAPMCTEYHAFLTGTPLAFPGHEAAGEVVAVEQPGKVNIGDRVVVMPQYPCGVCDLCISGNYIYCEKNHNFSNFTGGGEGSATMAQYLLKPSWLLPAIPVHLSYEHASLACCALGPSFEACDTMNVSAEGTLLITGAGPVGLGAVVNARFRGAGVIVVEAIPWRKERATMMGAVAVLDPHDEQLHQKIKDVTNGKGVDWAIECSGNRQAQRLCIESTRRKGMVAFVGQCKHPIELRISQDLIMKGLTLIGSWHYNRNHVEKVFQVIQTSPLIDLLISHVLPLSGIQEAFEIVASHESAKVILQPWK